MTGYHIKEALRGVAVLALIGAVLFVALRILAGCKAPEPGALPKYCTEEALYTAKLVRCVDEAETLAQSKQCRANVDYSCGIVQTITVKK